MISRLTAFATVFALVGAATLAFAASSPSEARSIAARAVAKPQASVVVLEPVFITVKRQPRPLGARTN